MAQCFLVGKSGGVDSTYIVQSTAPTDTNKLWVDTSQYNVLKFYNTTTSAWEGVGANWKPST